MYQTPPLHKVARGEATTSSLKNGARATLSYPQLTPITENLGKCIAQVVAAILYLRLTTSITFHDFLHGFREGRGTGTSNLEAKLLQKLEALRDEVLYMIFQDLHNAYGALDMSRCLDILEGYGVGPRARRLLQTYWKRLTMVARAGVYYGTAFEG